MARGVAEEGVGGMEAHVDHGRSGAKLMPREREREREPQVFDVLMVTDRRRADWAVRGLL
jgi:hypothetical protein